MDYRTSADLRACRQGIHVRGEAPVFSGEGAGDPFAGVDTRTRPRCTCTSCYRYWGEGVWTAYGAELARRTTEIVAHDL